MSQLGIQWRIFLSFTTVVAFIIFLLGYIYYDHTSKIIWKETLDSSSQKLSRLTSSLDANIKEMDKISVQAMNNTDLLDYFKAPYPLSSQSIESYEKLRALQTTLSSLNGPWAIAKQIRLFNLNGYILGLSNTSNLTPIKGMFPLSDSNIEDILNRHGDKKINPPFYTDVNKENLMFSLSRSIDMPPEQSPAIIEVQQPYALLEQIVSEIELDSFSDIFIFNADGTLFYPISAQNEFSKSFDTAKLPTVENEIVEDFDFNGHKNVLSLNRSTYTGLTVVGLQSKNFMMKPVYDLRFLTLFIVGITGLFFLFLSFFISRTITSPIRLLRHYVHKMEVETISIPLPMKKMKFAKELVELYITFSSMRTRLNKSIAQILESKNRESFAYQQALQAQMNPHFLFNTLTSISMVADEQNVGQLSEMCFKLSNMMRYISLPVTQNVNLSSEVAHTQLYLELMKFRYESRLDYELYLAPELESILVPKLILQPLVENSFLHGFQNIRPPWFISIRIERLNPETDGWKIRIYDNGCGFNDDSLEKVNQLINRLHANQIESLDELKISGIGGMGLDNTLTRYQLFWRDQIRFSVQNLHEGMEIVIEIS
jgi:two-component system sensor histidine kinase YesM